MPVSRNSTLMAKIKQRQQKNEAQRNKFWKPPMGLSVVRILPSWIDDNHEWYKDVFTHYNVGPNSSAVACLQQFNEKCPVCSRAAHLQRSNNAQDQDRAWEIRAQERVFMNVLPFNDPEGVIKIWSIANKPDNPDDMYTYLVEKFLDTKWGDFTDPDNGYNFDLNAEEKSFPNPNGKGYRKYIKYKIESQRDASYVGRDTWADELHDLDAEVLRYKRSPQQIIKIIKGEDVDDE